MPVPLLALSLALGVVGVDGAAAGHRNDFLLPSRNIACHYEPAARTSRAHLRCDILSGLRPEPRRRCPVDWTGLSLGARSRGAPTCAGDTVYNRRARALAYGRAWTRGPFRCVSRRTGLTCRNAGGHGFFLARERWRTW